MWLTKVIITGITTFIATNIDDLLILMFFFSQINSIFRRRHIIVGQYLGFTVLILASLLGFLGGLVIPKTWIGLLGVVPIIIGINSLINSQENESDVQTVAIKSESQNPQKIDSFGDRLMIIIASVMAPQTYNVATITFANGGDNIGIYVPLFASLKLSELLITLGIFYTLVGLWCYLAYQLIRHRQIAYILTRYGKFLTPFILIGLGLFIIIESESYQLFLQLF